MSTNTTTPTLTEFLTARLDEDEAAAKAASPSPWSYPGIESVAGGNLYDATRLIVSVEYEQPEDHDGSIVRHLLVPEADANGAHIARHDPARVLAQVAALRAILEEHYYMARHESRDFGFEDGNCITCRQQGPCLTVRHLASIYADHPDYDESWRLGS